jgi:hypothetical protein
MCEPPALYIKHEKYKFNPISIQTTNVNYNSKSSYTNWNGVYTHTSPINIKTYMYLK